MSEYQCSTNYQVKLIPLAFDLIGSGVDYAGDTIENLDAHILAALRSKQFRKAVDKAVREYNEKTLSAIKAGKEFSLEDGKAALKQIRTGFLDAGKKTIKDTTNYHLLKKEQEEFKRAFECSETGIWVNENKTQLIIVGAVGILGGVAYMYKNRTGDTIAKLTKDKLEATWKVGTVNLSTQVTTFEPSTRSFGLAFDAKNNWRSIKSSYSLNFLAQENNYSVSSKGAVSFPLTFNQTMSLGMTHVSTGRFGMSSDSTGDESTNRMSAFATVEYKSDEATMDLSAKYDTDDKFSFLASVKIKF